MNKDKEKMLINQAFEEMDTPEFDILAGIASKSKEQKQARPRIFRRSFVVAFVVVLATVSTVTAGYYLSIMERIHETAGELLVDAINPADAVFVPYAPTFQGRIWGQWSEDAIARDDIMIEVVATAAFDNIVDIYLLLQDLRYDRLAGDFVVMDMLRNFHSIDDAWRQSLVHSQSFAGNGQTVLERFDSGKVLLRHRFVFTAPVQAGLWTYEIDTIRFGETIDRVESFGMNLADLPPAQSIHSTIQNPIVNLMPTHFAFNPPGLVEMQREAGYRVATQGIEFLVPGQLALRSENSEINASISGMGIIDGRLHIQTYEPEELRFGDGVNVTLRNPDGIFLMPYMRLAFNVGDDGDFFGSTWQEGRFSFDAEFSEYIFDVELDNLHLYSLEAEFYSLHFIPIASVFSVRVETTDIIIKTIDTDLIMNMQAQTPDPSRNYYLPVRVESLHISPVSVRLDASFIDIWHDENGFLQLHPAPVGDHPLLPTNRLAAFGANPNENELEIHTTSGLVFTTILRTTTNIGWASQRSNYSDTLQMTFQLDEAIDIGSITAIYLSGLRAH